MNENNAAQAATKDIREGFELTYAADADDPACAADLFHFTNGWRACIMSQVGKPVVMKLAVDATAAIDLINAEAARLRAPVADERAAFDPEVLAERLRDVAASHYETALGFGISRDNFERCATDAAKIAQDMASAPVAGEAQPNDAALDKLYRETVTEGSEVDTRCWENPHRLYARAVLAHYAAPQASAEPKQYTHAEVFGPMESAWNAALEQAAAICDAEGQEWDSDALITEKNYAEYCARRIRSLKQPQADKDGCTCPSGDGSLRHPCPMHPGADKDGGQQREGVVTDDMRYAVRFAPSSAHWSERLKEFFGPDAREGIDALEKQLREARAMLDRQQRAEDRAAVEAMAHLRTIASFGGTLEQAKDLAARGIQRCAALSATQPEQGERD